MTEYKGACLGDGRKHRANEACRACVSKFDWTAPPPQILDLTSPHFLLQPSHQAILRLQLQK